jgi:hypothetical protein
MLVKHKVILATGQALRALDYTKDTPYTFDGTVLLAIARFLNRCNQVSEDIEGVRQKILRKHNIVETKRDPEAVAKYQEEFMAVLEEEVEILTHTFKIGDFKLDTNRIPGSVLAALMWTIADQEDGPKK